MVKRKSKKEREWTKFDILMDKLLSIVPFYRRIKTEWSKTTIENDQLRTIKNKRKKEDYYEQRQNRTNGKNGRI